MSDMILANDAERMDRHYRFQRYIYDLTRTHYLIGRQHLIGNLRPTGGQSVLEIGCGTAWNLARIAHTYPGARLYGIDVSNAMLDTARASLARRGLATRVALAQGDATSFDPQSAFGIALFDRIIFSYALSMIPRWQDALEHAAGMMAPGGEVHIVDFGQCENLPVIVKRALFAFLRQYTVSPRADLDAFLDLVGDRSGLGVQCSRLHRGYTDYAVLVRPT